MTLILAAAALSHRPSVFVRDNGTPAISAWIGDTEIATSHFGGVIDDVRVYNRALTAAEVKQLYKLGTVIIRQ